MRPGGRGAVPVAALVAACLLACGPAAAQLVLGQYEDEAPLGTWNLLGAPSAATSGVGVLFARAFDASVSLANPAALTAFATSSVSLSGSLGFPELYRFSLVNTGAVASSGNLRAGVVGLDHGAFSVRVGNWAFAAAVAVPESYARPSIVAGSAAAGATYELRFDQTGLLRVFHAAAARRLGARLSVGLGINAVSGRTEKSTVERTETPGRVITITDVRAESLRGVYLNGGIAWEAGAGMTVAAVVRSPYVKKGRASSALRYEVPAAGTDIAIEAEATNEYRQPWVVGAGWAWAPAGAWTVAAEAAWFGWSAYEVLSFDEPRSRAFRNVVRAGAGAEYAAASRLFGRTVGIPFRLGLSLDPQPMRQPRSAYLSVSFGTGLRTPSLAVDVSGSFGREHGSGDRLKAGRIVLSCRYDLARRRP